MLCISKSGQCLKPFIILKGTAIHRLRKFTEESRVISVCNSKAWMTTQLMISWLTRVLIPYTENQHSILLMENFAPHRDATLLEIAATNNVHVVYVPPRCTPVAQPCDIRVNAFVKKEM